MKKKGDHGVWFAIAFLAVAGVMLVLTALSGEKQAFSNEKEQTEISFSWWGNDNRHKYTMEGIENFEQKNPDINVKEIFGVWNGYSKRQQMAIASRTNADVMQINYAWISQYSPDGTGFYDLNQLSDILHLNEYTKEDLAYGKVGQYQNAVPIAYNVSTCLYNKDIYDSFSGELPFTKSHAYPQTWDDLFAAAKVMSRKDIYPLSAVKKHMWMMLLAWYEQKAGHPAFSEDGTCSIDESGMEAILTFYKSLIDEKVCPPVDQADTSFSSQNAAGILCWISDTDRYGEALMDGGVHVEIGPLYTDGASYSGWYMKPATMYAISRTTRHPQEAARLLDFLVQDKDMVLLQRTEKGVPINQKAYFTLSRNGKLSGITEDAQKEFVDERDHRKMLATMPVMIENDDVIDAFKKVSDKYIYGQETLENCAAEFMEAVSQAQTNQEG